MTKGISYLALADIMIFCDRNVTLEKITVLQILYAVQTAQKKTRNIGIGLKQDNTGKKERYMGDRREEEGRQEKSNNVIINIHA